MLIWVWKVGWLLAVWQQHCWQLSCSVFGDQFVVQRGELLLNNGSELPGRQAYCHLVIWHKCFAVIRQRWRVNLCLFCKHVAYEYSSKMMEETWFWVSFCLILTFFAFSKPKASVRDNPGVQHFINCSFWENHLKMRGEKKGFSHCHQTRAVQTTVHGSTAARGHFF